MNHSQCILGDIQTKAEGALAHVNMLTGLLSASYILLKPKTVPCQETNFRKNCFLLLFFPPTALTFEEQRLHTHKSAIIKTKGKKHHNQLSTTISGCGECLFTALENTDEDYWILHLALVPPLHFLLNCGLCGLGRLAETQMQHHKAVFDWDPEHVSSTRVKLTWGSPRSAVNKHFKRLCTCTSGQSFMSTLGWFKVALSQ